MRRSVTHWRLVGFEVRAPSLGVLSHRYDVAILGAGVSGLTAASLLARSGLDVIVVEGRDRIGGRTHTVEAGGGLFDLGGAWIHDPASNPLTAHLAKIGLEWRPDAMYGNGLLALDGDQRASAALTSTLIAAMYNFDPGEAAVALGGEGDRLSGGIEWYIDSKGLSGDRARLVGEFIGRVIGSGITGDAPEGVSLAGMAAYKGEESGHNGVIAGGYRSLVNHLAEGVDIALMPRKIIVRFI